MVFISFGHGRTNRDAAGGSLAFHDTAFTTHKQLASAVFIPECLQCLIFDVCLLLSTRTELSYSQRVVTKTETASIYETSRSCCDVTATDFIRTFRVILSTS